MCAAGAASRSAMLSVDRDFVASRVASTRPAPQSNHLSIHERIIREENEVSVLDFLEMINPISESYREMTSYNISPFICLRRTGPSVSSLL